MIEVSKETFKEEIEKCNVPVVVDFWGPQCVPCLALMPSMEALSGKYAEKIKIAKVEAPKNRRLCMDLRVSALPTILLFKDGKEIERFSGDGVSAQIIEESVQKLLK